MSEGMAHQNMDIEFNLLSESFWERSFAAYGLKLPRIKEVLPTNLPSVEANEMRMDNLFLLEDGTLAIVDYESDNKAASCIKYINYIGRVMERWHKEHHGIPNIRMIVIYTGDVEKADAVFQMECMTLCIEQVFVRSLPAEEIYQTVLHKLEQEERLTEQELMQLIILPLAEKGSEKKQERIVQVMELAERLEDEQEQKLVLSGLLVSSDKFIEKENMRKIRRRFNMTKIGRSIYENGMKDKARQTAERLLKRGVDMETIMDATDLTEEEVKEIEKSMLVSQ